MNCIDFNNDFTHAETDTSNIYKSKQPNKNGFTFTISFTKDKLEHEQSMKAIKEFFVREVF